MVHIKVVSLDNWLTISRSNPDYSVGRSLLIQRLLAPSVPLDEVERIVRQVKDGMDKKTVSEDGRWYGFTDRLNAIYQLLPANARIPSLDAVISVVEQGLIDLMRSDPPHLIEEDVADVLAEIKARGVKLALISNTGFIDGVHMKVAFETKRIWRYFDYPIFSNEVGVAKPNQLIFQHLVEKAGVLPREILHVGDDYEADVIGATVAGFQTLHFSHEGKGQISTLWDILKYL